MSDLKFHNYRGVSVSWDKNEVRGQSVSVQASHSDDFHEVRSVPNRGSVNLAFGPPGGHKVVSHVRVEGSKEGVATGTVTVAE